MQLAGVDLVFSEERCGTERQRRRQEEEGRLPIAPEPDGGLGTPTSRREVPSLFFLRGAWRSGQELLQDTTVRAVVSLVAPDAVEDDVAARKQLDDRGRANAVVPSPFLLELVITTLIPSEFYSNFKV